jgi:glucose/mannose transport system substrate-binding protein
MKKFTVVAGLATALLGSTSIQAADVEVIHWWTSGGEQAAVSVFANEFDALGEHAWIDTAIALGENARAATMQRVLGGDPPGAAQFNPGRQYEELIAAGLLLDLTPLAEEEGWADIIRPAVIAEPCFIDGKWWCVPVNIHSEAWMWASVPAFEEAGVELPTSIMDFVDNKAAALEEAGLIPYAQGGEPWQLNAAFGAVQIATLGIEQRDALLRDKDMDIAMSPEFTEVFETFRGLKQYSDEGSPGRNWNDTTNLVLTDQAGIQIMGDWARGEFGVAGEEPGVDYDCLPIDSENPFVTTGGDIFLFFKQDDPEVEAAQLEMASMMISPRVQALFNVAKGSMPVRDDVDLSLADSCMQKGLEILSDPANVVTSANIWLTADTTGQFQDLIAEFWSNDDMPIEEAQQRYADILAAAD